MSTRTVCCVRIAAASSAWRPLDVVGRVRNGLGGEFGEVDGFSGGPLMRAGHIRPHREHADFE
jgi:hypothetical protein